MILCYAKAHECCFQLIKDLTEWILQVRNKSKAAVIDFFGSRGAAEQRKQNIIVT